MGHADTSSKYLLAGDPEEWIRWLLQDDATQVQARLSEEFQFLARHSDALFRVHGQAGAFVLAVEVQLRIDPRMPRRMRAYTALAEEKYNLPVYPVVFYLLPPGVGVEPPRVYHSEFMGLTAHQDFRVVAVWELEARRVLEEEIVALIPFVPLMRGADEGIIQAGVRLLHERDVGQEAQVALALFASFVMPPAQVRQIVRWDMHVLRESPWYVEILQEGLEQGREQGLEQGREQGLEQGREQGRRQGILEGRRQDIVHFLRLRFDLDDEHLAEISERLAAVEDEDRLLDLLVMAGRADRMQAFMESLD
jgi:predicted transposase YdaD